MKEVFKGQKGDITSEVVKFINNNASEYGENQIIIELIDNEENL